MPVSNETYTGMTRYAEKLEKIIAEGKQQPVATLRDQFAIAALTGFQTFVRGGWSGRFPDDLADHVASNCYALADAMLRARAQEGDR